MHIIDIRRHCLHCGHHKLVKVPVFRDMKEDYCEVAGTPCAKVRKCEPEIRIPKKQPDHRTGESYLKAARGRARV